MLPQFNSDSNPCSSSFFRIASGARIVVVLMVEMSLKNILLTSISILRIERNLMGPNQVNTADDSTHSLHFESKIDEQ